MTIYQITNINDPSIIEFFNLKKNSTPKGCFIAESEKVVFKLLSSDLKTLKIFCTEKYLEKIKALNSNANIYVAPLKILEKITGINLHQGILALAEIPTLKKVTDLRPPILIFNAIEKAENVGSLIRNSAAFGFNSIIYDSLSCSPYNRRSARVSMGNLFAAEVARSVNLISDIQELQANRVQVIAAANSNTAIDISKFNFKKDCAIIIGNEGHGISKEILNASDAIVRIPINPNVAHINASHAGAIFFYEYTKTLG